MSHFLLLLSGSSAGTFWENIILTLKASAWHRNSTSHTACIHQQGEWGCVTLKPLIEKIRRGILEKLIDFFLKTKWTKDSNVTTPLLCVGIELQWVYCHCWRSRNRPAHILGTYITAFRNNLRTFFHYFTGHLIVSQGGGSRLVVFSLLFFCHPLPFPSSLPINVFALLLWQIRQWGVISRVPPAGRHWASGLIETPQLVPGGYTNLFLCF